LFLLTSCNNLDKVRIKPTEEKQLIANKLWASLIWERDLFLKHCIANKYAFPDKYNLEEKPGLGEKITFKSIREAQCFYVDIPTQVPFKDVFKEFKKYI